MYPFLVVKSMKMLEIIYGVNQVPESPEVVAVEIDYETGEMDNVVILDFLKKGS